MVLLRRTHIKEKWRREKRRKERERRRASEWGVFEPSRAGRRRGGNSTTLTWPGGVDTQTGGQTKRRWQSAHADELVRDSDLFLSFSLSFGRWAPSRFGVVCVCVCMCTSGGGDEIRQERRERKGEEEKEGGGGNPNKRENKEHQESENQRAQRSCAKE